MFPTVSNFAELLRDEVYTLRVMYRIGEMRRGYTAWEGWVESNIEDAPDDANAGVKVDDYGFRVVDDDEGRCWSYSNRETDIEEAYEQPFGGFVFDGCEGSHHGEQCIQIVFMDAYDQHRRASRNLVR